MMRKTLTSFCILSLAMLFAACDSQRSKNQNPGDSATVETTKPADDELIIRLSADLVPNAQTPADRDRNALINYAIDHALDVQATASGLYYQVLSEGTGELLKWGERVSAHYKGNFLDGEEFDSSYRRNKPIEFYIGNMIDGWNEGLQLLRPGGKIRLLVPSKLGYAAEGLKGANDRTIVPPDAVLIFYIEVLEKLEKQE